MAGLSQNGLSQNTSRRGAIAQGRMRTLLVVEREEGAQGRVPRLVITPVDLFMLDRAPPAIDPAMVVAATRPAPRDRDAGGLR